MIGDSTFARVVQEVRDDLTAAQQRDPAEDLRPDGTVARYPWGKRPVGSIVVEGGWCYVQIMSSDVPSFGSGGAAVGKQMKAALLSTYIAYAGACTNDETAGSVTLKVEAAWRPDYIGTEQKRFFRFENGKLIFGPAPNSIRSGTETLSRRLTLARASPAVAQPQNPPDTWLELPR